MYSLKEFMQILEGYAPLEISYKAIERGDYDNSGVIVDSGVEVKKVLFSLDLSLASIQKAEEIGADTIVTHHPAIYTPIKSLDCKGDTAPLLKAIKGGMNVVSMHLNLDMADKGIDYYLAEALGGETQKILDFVCDDKGYGREFTVNSDTEDIKERAKVMLGTDKVLLYGMGKVEKVATFCGGGASNALEMVEKGVTDADLIVSSDMPHHVLKGLIESGRAVLIIPHYASEQYGFKKFYQEIISQTKDELKVEYFEDKRFM